MVRMGRFNDNAMSILEIAESAMEGNLSAQEWTIVIGSEGGIRMIGESDWPLETLQSHHGAEMVYRVRQQGNAILEASAIHNTERRRGRGRCQSFQRWRESLPHEPALQIFELVASQRDPARVGIGEKIRDERGEPSSSCGGTERASRHRRDKQGCALSWRASGQGYKRRGNRDRAASPT